MVVRIKLNKKYLKQLREKHNSNTLRKFFSADTTQKLLKGDASITLKNFYKLCKVMDWKFPEYFDVEVIED
jgi:hypothetical protein